MSLQAKTKANCPFCNAEQEVSYYSSVNVTISPDLKERVLKGTLNSCICTSCGKEINVVSGFLYHDMKNRTMINLKVTEGGDASASEMLKKMLEDGYIYREVFSYPELVEKIRIFDLKLNDVVIGEVSKRLRIMLDESLKNIENTEGIKFQVLFKDIEKGFFSKKLSFYCFSHPSQMMELKQEFKQLTEKELKDLFDFEKLRIRA